MDRKVVLLLIACLIQGISGDRRGMPTEILTCSQKENVPYTALLSYGSERMPTVAETESLPNYKCFFTCILEASNLVDSCTINFPTSTNEISNDPHSRDVALRLCKDAVKGTERCECGYELYKCMIEFFSKNVLKENKV